MPESAFAVLSSESDTIAPRSVFAAESLTADHLHALPIARYEFRVRARHATFLPPFLGSTLRGAFGHALKAICCSVEHQNCHQCLLADACHYPAIFEPSALPLNGPLGGKRNDPPRPFVFQPPLPLAVQANVRVSESQRAWRRREVPVPAGTVISFGLTLFGPAVEKLPYIVYAVELMSRHGFGFARTPFELVEVLDIESHVGSRPLYRPGMERMAQVNWRATTLGDLVAQRMTQFSVEDVIDLVFITPAWIQVQGTLIKELSCLQLVSRLSWRLAQMFDLYGERPLAYDHRELIALAETVHVDIDETWIHHFERYSSRQRDKTPMKGIMGRITYRGAAVRDLLPLLLTGEFLQVGKETAFGLGRYWIAG